MCKARPATGIFNRLNPFDIVVKRFGLQNTPDSQSGFSLSNLFCWLSVVVACFANADLWSYSFYKEGDFSRLDKVGLGLFLVGMSFCVLFLPIRWLLANISESLLFRFTVMAAVSAPAFMMSRRFILCLWFGIFFFFVVIFAFKKMAMVIRSEVYTLFASGTIGLAVVSFNLSSSLSPTHATKTLVQMRERFPIVDLTLQMSRDLHLNGTHVQLTTRAQIFQQRLQNAFNDYSKVQRSLKQLHSPHFERFVRSPELGVSMPDPRIIQFWSKPLTLDPRAPSRYHDADYISTFCWVLSGGSKNDHGLSPETLHLYSIFDFVHPTTLGEKYDETNLHVGFRRHGVTFPHTLIVNAKCYSSNRIEVIGPFREETDLSDVNIEVVSPVCDPEDRKYTRILSKFEASALTQLKQGESLVVQNDESTVRMLGAIRSVSQCNSCHNCASNDLLGAFSYEFLLQEGPLSDDRAKN